MSCELILSYHLNQSAALAALVGTRIFPTTLPLKVTTPGVVTALAMEEPRRTVGGTGATRMVYGTAIAVAIAPSPDKLKAVCEAVRSAANQKIGPAADWQITTCHYTRSEADQFDVELELHSRVLYFSVTFVEAQP